MLLYIFLYEVMFFVCVFVVTSQEFEVIAQIKLLQMASKTYQILPNEKFREWFDDINVLSYENWWAINLHF